MKTLTLVPYCHRAPALSVVQQINEQGWRVTTDWILPGHLAQVDAWRKTLTIPGDFESRLACPELAREVQHWVLAHELAHIVLHGAQLKRGERTPTMEREAARWSLEFLLPQHALLDHPEARALSAATPAAERWARCARVAESFHVPITAVDLALSLYMGEKVPLGAVLEMLAA